ncbi:hypothetical protein [Streptomyces griseorubiginosus]|uniref:hypothetical protein n=1 Tax=Streptomyces griseorubiginosus TaxID=67304 RepID=UPI00366999AF
MSTYRTPSDRPGGPARQAYRSVVFWVGTEAMMLHGPVTADAWAMPVCPAGVRRRTR